jgi:c-di-GMP-related signal transduction protein
MVDKTADIALVSRQPIYDRKGKLFAYELLYRNQFDNSENSDGDASTAEVLRNTFLEIGLPHLVGDNLAFVNLTSGFILGDYCSALPPDRVVLEVLETVVPDDAIIRALSRLSDKGYKIALDDFVYSDDKIPMLEIADYVKVDFRMFNPQEISDLVERLKPFKVQLLAEKVETHEEFDRARESGFDYFQGYFFCQPRTLKASRIPLNRLSHLRLITQLKDSDASVAEMEKLIKQDIAVSYNLLRFVNSALVSPVQRVESIAHAIQMVGIRQIRVWASVLLLSTFEDKPRELTITALFRGRMAELLAIAQRWPNPDAYFTVGLFSVVDALLDRPMPDALDLLPFNDEIRGALLRREGKMGAVLRCVWAYETANWNDVECGNLSLFTIRKCYLESLAFALEVTKVAVSK